MTDWAWSPGQQGTISFFFFFLSFFPPRLPSTMGFLIEVYEVTSSWLYGGIRGELTPGEVTSLWCLNGVSDPWKSMLCYTGLILDKWVQKLLRFHCFFLPYYVHYLLRLKHGGTGLGWLLTDFTLCQNAVILITVLLRKVCLLRFLLSGSIISHAKYYFSISKGQTCVIAP